MNEIKEKIEKIEFLSDKEISKLNYYELCLYLEFINNLKEKYEDVKNG